MDLCKTNFLVKRSIYDGHTLVPMRRKRQTALIERDGTPRCLMSLEDWRKLKADWPKEVEADGLSLRTIWTLVPA